VKGSTVGTGLCAGSGCETRQTWFGTARGRLGYAGWDRWLPYFTGGAAFGGIKTTTGAGVEDTQNRFGWTLGGGIEYALMSNWTAKVEYLYADLGTKNDVSFKENIVRAGLNYRF
jgi:outer membrane immunogenic protein